MLLLLSPRRDGKARTFVDVDQLIALSQATSAVINHIQSAQRNREVGKLTAVPIVAAGIGHDLKQFAASFLFFAELMEIRSDPKELIDQHLPRFKKQVKNLTSLSNQLSQLGNPVDPHIRAVDIKLSINDLITDPKTRTTDLCIEISTSPLEEIPLIQADEHLLLRALQNLCLNAIEAMQDQSDGVMHIEGHCHRKLC